MRQSSSLTSTSSSTPTFPALSSGAATSSRFVRAGTTSSTLRSDRIDGGVRDEVFLKPGLTWTPPRGFGAKAYIRDRFELGAFLRLGVHDTDSDFGAGGRVKVRFDTKRLTERRR